MKTIRGNSPFQSLFILFQPPDARNAIAGKAVEPATKSALPQGTMGQSDWYKEL
ncbi:MAG: hypothetical protein ACKVP0_03675 [Pirellulaceae bacterium]